MQFNLEGKRVLVTGSSKGIGLAIARCFSKAGCLVMLNSRKKIANKILRTVDNSDAAIGDVSTEQGAEDVISQSIKKLGGLDVVICNVGNGRSVPPGEESLIHWQKAFEQNFYSTTCKSRQLQHIWRSRKELLSVFLLYVA